MSGVSVCDEVFVQRRVVEGVVAGVEHHGFFAAPRIDAHPGRDFLPVGNLTQVRLGKPLPDRIRGHAGSVFGVPVRLRDGLQPHAPSRTLGSQNSG